MRREKYREASQNSGATTIAASASRHERTNSTAPKTASRTTAESASTTPESTKPSMAATSPVTRDMVSPSRRRSWKLGESRCRWRKTSVRRRSRKRWLTEVSR